MRSGRPPRTLCVQRSEMRRERRVAARYHALLPVKFRCDSVVSEGILVDVSLVGARIEGVDRRPPPGKRLDLVLRLAASDRLVEVPVEVIRHTETRGFAVRFCESDVRVLRILRMLLHRLEELSEMQESRLIDPGEQRMEGMRPDKEESERRSAPRAPGRVRYSAGRIEGTGSFYDLSLTGACISTQSGIPRVGTAATLFFCSGEDNVVTVSAEVVRELDNGFAVRFVRLDPRIQAFLIAALPLTSALREKS